MERPVSVLHQRTMSFNPEAVAFSPVFSSPPLQDIAFATTTSSTPPLDANFPFAMAPMFNYSTFRDMGSTPSIYRRDPLTPAPVRLEDSPSLDVQTLVQKLEEDPDVKEIRAPQTPKLVAEPAAQVARGPRPSLPPFTFPAPAPEPQTEYAPVDINELSVGLGLPSAEADISEDTSTIVSHESRVPQAHPGALYDFLQQQHVSTLPQAPALSSVSPAQAVARGKQEGTPTKPKSPSFQGTKTSGSRHIAASAPAETIAVHSGPSAHHQHHRSSIPTASYRQHTRISSHRRYSRRPSRVKRLDQGPMPSAADIYPDDAHFTPVPIYEDHTQSFFEHLRMPEQAPNPANPIIVNPFNWPPPAQVYAPEAPPTLADIHAADTDVLALMNELPEPSLCTLAKLGNTHDLRATSAFGLQSDILESDGLNGDERALTPAQEDGSRYGIRFWGLGYGDQWELSKIGKSETGEQFKIGSNEHEGWSEREWALRQGWGA